MRVHEKVVRLGQLRKRYPVDLGLSETIGNIAFHSFKLGLRYILVLLLISVSN